MTPPVLRIGTRGSLLATTQAGHVAQALTDAGHPAELVIIKTQGDKSAAPVTEIGVGVFTTELRVALRNDEIDVAVHSYKDLPTAPEPDLVIAAVPPREDARDALVSNGNRVLGALPVGATVGTSAPRRVAQLRALGLGLEIRPLRGNLDSRLGKVANGELDAVVVARAGLARIGRTEVIAEAFDPVVLLPAPAQGALAVECRADDAQLVSTLATLDDPSSRAAVDAERAVLAALEAGCTAPVGAYAEVVESLDDDGRIFLELSLRAAVAAVDGSDVIRSSAVGPIEQAAQVGRALAAEMLESGAASLLA
ncbi:hydroxymethylbilane synthase [Gordonia crocea]|uniref:Porphobilinogen deaminase n=1 Tax=Gordonia crocea TaxID=589162 RepID=A0A7I9V0M3_9ACTN|nr:hydroxymethylbilane synthase [Gordonia crocea]GED98935.1 porphobilinogen deaminase [Gordonia crocea]GED98996.1 porphobilinogen deaminase [Gordonia crocea]